MANSDERPLLIIDGDNLAHRAYHSMPKSLRSKDGRPINAILGWTNMLVTLWDNEQPRSVFVAWDTLGIDTYRHKLWPTYQGGRVFDDAIVRQLDLLPTLASAFGFGVGKRAGYEADDFMAAAAIAETRRGGRSLLLTTDRDAYQLVNDTVTVLARAANVRGAAAFVRFLLGPVGRATLLRHGLQVLSAKLAGPSSAVPTSLRALLPG